MKKIEESEYYKGTKVYWASWQAVESDGWCWAVRTTKCYSAPYSEATYTQESGVAKTEAEANWSGEKHLKEYVSYMEHKGTDSPAADAAEHQSVRFLGD